MALAVAFTDNEDGTGAVATVSGSTAGTTNTVYVQRFSGELGSTATWSSPGNRTGDGTVACAIDDGHYFGHVINNNSGTLTISPVEYFVATDGTTSVHYRCAVAAQSRIRLLELDGIDDSNVTVRKVPVDRHIGASFDVKYPAIVLATSGIENQPPTSGTNIRDDIGYPVLCSIVAADQQQYERNHETFLKWREQINRAFRNQRLPGVSEIIYANVQPAQIVDLPAWLINKFHSSMILRFISRESRGID